MVGPIIISKVGRIEKDGTRLFILSNEADANSLPTWEIEVEVKVLGIVPNINVKGIVDVNWILENKANLNIIKALIDNGITRLLLTVRLISSTVSTVLGNKVAAKTRNNVEIGYVKVFFTDVNNMTYV